MWMTGQILGTDRKMTALCATDRMAQAGRGGAAAGRGLRASTWGPGERQTKMN